MARVRKPIWRGASCPEKGWVRRKYAILCPLSPAESGQDVALYPLWITAIRPAGGTHEGLKLTKAGGISSMMGALDRPVAPMRD